MKKIFRNTLPALLTVLVIGSCFLQSCSEHNDVQGAVGDDYETELLKRFQPILVQELAENYSTLPYPEESDRIGALSLHEGDENYEYMVGVDTTRPVMYAIGADLVRIHNSNHYQLMYSFFYPERPLPSLREDGLFKFIERYLFSGLIDGKVIRITLDRDDETPLFIEIAALCGCYWKLYVNSIIDDAMRAEFEDAGQEYPGLVKPESPHDVQYVWILPEDVENAPTRIVVAAEDGWTVEHHWTLGGYTSYEQWFASDAAFSNGVLYLPEDQEVEIFDAGGLSTEYFSIHPYDDLYRMKPQGSDLAVGIFDEYHHVWNSYSPYTKFLRDLGRTKKFPGTPWDPNRLEIVHETIDYWRSDLFDQFIHMPAPIFDPDAS